MSRIIRSYTSSNTIRVVTRSAAKPNLIQQRRAHVSLLPLHRNLHQTSETAPNLHGLRLHDHHSYQTSPGSSVKASQISTSTSGIQTSKISTSIPESKTTREIRESRVRQAAIGREINLREVHGRARTLRNLGIWDFPALTMKKSEARIIASQAIASSVSPKKEEQMITEQRLGGTRTVRKGINPLLSRARGDSERTLCAADLDNIYNL